MFACLEPGVAPTRGTARGRASSRCSVDEAHLYLILQVAASATIGGRNRWVRVAIRISELDQPIITSYLHYVTASGQPGTDLGDGHGGAEADRAAPRGSVSLKLVLR